MRLHRSPAYRLAILCLALLPYVAPAAARNGLVHVTILQTTDIHGRIVHGDEDADSGGMLRIATLIERERHDAGPENTLLIDCGDTIQGTLAAAVTRGQIVVDLLNQMRYDIWVPGNHELDFGIAHCIALLRDFNGQILCGNVAFIEETGTVQYPAWHMFQRAGARIAVIGLNSSYLENWFWGDDYTGFDVESADAVLERAMPEILAHKPDMIILAAHQGWLPTDTRGVNEIRDVVRRFPEIDLVLGGHTHWPHAGAKIGPTTWYVQAGHHAESLAVVVATIDTRRRQVLNVTSKLLTAGREIRPHPEATAAVAEQLEQAAGVAAEIVGTIARPLSAEGRVGIDCETSEFLSRAIATETGAAVVVHGRLSRKSLAQGPVTEADLFDLVPYENVIGIALLDEADLRRILDEQFANRSSYVACGVYGMTVYVDASGQSVKLTLPDGSPIAGRLAVAFNSYTLAGGGGRFPVLRKIVRQPAAQLRDTGLDTRQIVRRFLQSHPDYAIAMRPWIQPYRTNKDSAP